MNNNWEELGNNFIKQKQRLGYKYNTDTIVMKEITQFLREEKISKITKDTVEKYAKLNSNRKSNTIARNIGVFREFCKYLKMQDISCYQIPLKLYPQHHKAYIPYIFSKKEVKSIIKNSYQVAKEGYYSFKKDQTLPLIYKLLYQTGMRIGEILNLKVKDYKEQEYFLIEQSKNGEDRRIYLPEKLNQEILKYHLKFHYNIVKEEYFFQLKTEKRIGINTIERNFYKILKKSNIPRKENSPRVHDLRHTYIVHCIEKWLEEKKNINVMLPILQTHVGHTSLKSLEHYFQITQNMINEIGKISENKLGKLIPELKDVLENE